MSGSSRHEEADLTHRTAPQVWDAMVKADAGRQIDLDRLAHLGRLEPVEPRDMPGVEVVCEFGVLDDKDIRVWQSKLPAGEKYLPASRRHVITLSLRDIPQAVCLHRGQVRAGPFLAGELHIVPAGEATYIHLDAPGEFLHLGFAAHALQSLASSDRSVHEHDAGLPSGSFVVDDTTLSSLVRLLNPQAHSGQHSLTREFVDSVVRAVCAHLAQYYQDRASSKAKGLSDAELARLNQYVLRHVAEPISRAQLARHLGMSATHLARLVKVRTGQALGQHVRHLRLTQAYRLLESGRLNVTGVAMATGFADLPHFSRQFRSHFGLSPSMLLNRATKKN